MAKHIKIKTDTDEWVHFDTGVNSYTLCGLETDGDGIFEIQTGKTVKTKVNCPSCLEILFFCQEIKNNEYEQRQV